MNKQTSLSMNVFATYMVLLKYAGIPLVLFATIDFAAAMWTLLSLKK